MPLAVLTYTLGRIQAVLDLTDRLLTSEFPQPYCKEGIELIRKDLNDRKELVQKLGDRTIPALLHAACQESLNTLFELLPVLGFFLRSTNVRNAFELYGPLARLARRLVPDVKLVLSSEWDYSPSTLHQVPHLPGYVLIGLPASESSNGLALPLAGHELGHAVWAHEVLEREFEPKVRNALLAEIKERWSEYNQNFPGIEPEDLQDLAGYRSWLLAHRWSMSQAEEHFCDQLGVRVFGQSYLHAFAYLLAPGLPARNPNYPANRRRAESLVEACDRWKLTPPEDYAENFMDETSGLSGTNQFLLSIADASVAAIGSGLLDRCDQICTQATLPLQDEMEVSKVLRAFEKLIPGAGSTSLCSVANAGWQAFNDAGFWSGHPHIRERKVDVLNELVLKTIEILEVDAQVRGE